MMYQDSGVDCCDDQGIEVVTEEVTEEVAKRVEVVEILW